MFTLQSRNDVQYSTCCTGEKIALTEVRKVRSIAVRRAYSIAIAKTITGKARESFPLGVKHLSLLFNASNEQDSVLIFHLFFFLLGGLGYASLFTLPICLDPNPVSCP
jgi:hypothetical protein